MNCPSCGKPGVIMEGTPGGGSVHVKCLKCGWTEIRDSRNKPMLTEVPETDSRRVLTENCS